MEKMMSTKKMKSQMASMAAKMNAMDKGSKPMKNGGMAKRKKGY